MMPTLIWGRVKNQQKIRKAMMETRYVGEEHYKVMVAVMVQLGRIILAKSWATLPRI